MLLPLLSFIGLFFGAYKIRRLQDERGEADFRLWIHSPGVPLVLLGQAESPRPLNAFERWALAPYIPEVDLKTAVLHFGEPFPATFIEGVSNDDLPVAGMAVGNHIWFADWFSSNIQTIGALCVLAHELEHVGQFRQGLTVDEYKRESAKHGYGNRYEIPAYGKGNEVRRGLMAAAKAYADRVGRPEVPRWRAARGEPEEAAR